MKKVLGYGMWVGVSVLAALALGVVALQRGEPVNSIWLVTAAVCIYALGYRFYAKFIAAKVMALDDRRATPAERLRNGHDFEPTNKWIVFGHHFAAIAGPGPLVGPTLAAQFGYLPGDAVDHLRRGARRLRSGLRHPVLRRCAATASRSAQMAREEIGQIGGFTALVTVLLIMIILLAVIALVVVNALQGSPWGTFTIAATMPIAVFMGLYLRLLAARARCWKCPVIGFVLVLAEHLRRPVRCRRSRRWRRWFTISAMTLAIAIIVYGFLASALPVWLLLAPRDYLSTFVKLGVVILLGVGILFVRPRAQLPRADALRRRHRADLRRQDLSVLLHHDRVRRDQRLPLADFFRHDAEADRPRMARAAGRLRRRWRSKASSAIMALIAACALQPGVFFAVNSPAGIVGATPAGGRRDHHRLGISGDGRRDGDARATQVGEKTLFVSHRRRAVARPRHGAHLRADRRRSSAFIGFWYHFAIMFEALFILTILDAGTRVGRFMLQDLLGQRLQAARAHRAGCRASSAPAPPSCSRGDTS